MESLQSLQSDLPDLASTTNGVIDYHYCDQCDKNVLNTYFHCKICNDCVEIKNHRFCEQCSNCSYNTYEHCEKCMKCVPAGLEHCDKCNICKHIGYKHCDLCNYCYNIKYSHCKECDKCHFFMLGCEDL
jgi:hypothetical protein